MTAVGSRGGEAIHADGEPLAVDGGLVTSCTYAYDNAGRTVRFTRR